MRFAQRIGGEIGKNRWAQALELQRARSAALLDLTESNPTRCAFRFLNDELLRPFLQEDNLRYEPDPHGLRVAREAIAAYYAEKGISLDPQQILLTASTSEAYGYLFRLLLDPGDRILAPKPSYPLIEPLTALHDVALQPYSVTYDGHWKISWESIAARRADAKALLVVNPNNPTGNFIREDAWEKLTRLSADSDIPLIADEVFLDYDLRIPDGLDAPDASPVTSLARPSCALTFTLGGISKLLALPQMKLSWIVVNGPRGLRDQALERLEVIADTFLSVNTPACRALTHWLAGRNAVRSEILERVSSNRAFLSGALKGCRDLRLLASEGGWYAVLAADSAFEDEALCVRLMKKRQVIAHPGYFFDFDDGCYLVISLILPRNRFEEGVSRLVRELSE